MLGWTRNRLKTSRSGSPAFRNHHPVAPLPLDRVIWRFSAFSHDFVQKIRQTSYPQPCIPRNQGAEIWVSFHNFDEFFRNDKKSSHMTCIYFYVSLNVSGHEFKILGESYVAVFFYLASNSSEKVMGTGHDFLLPLVAAPHTTIPDGGPSRSARGPWVSEASWRSTPSARQSNGNEFTILTKLANND